MFLRGAEKVLFLGCKCIKNKKFCSLVQQYRVPIEIESTEIDKVERPSALDCVTDDLSTFTPYHQKSFNLAGYVNTSETLQKLIQLNVDLSKIEKKPHIAEKLLKLDFEKDIKHHIIFLKDYINIEDIGSVITKNSLILHESLEDLKVRINYLESKCFSKSQIVRIINKNPFWLMFTTTRIDRRLGFYQEKFNLPGKEVRLLAAKQPRIITYNLHQVKTNMFVLQEEMGFNEHELKRLILHKPKLYMISQKALLERFNFIHNVMHIPHHQLLENPEVLLSRTFRIKQRHLFLARLGRAQYEPKKENYVPIKSLVEGNDIEFCKNYAKCSVTDYNLFLKTL